MRTITRALSAIILLALGNASLAMQAASHAWSEQGALTAPDAPELLVHQNGGLTLDQAVEQVRRQYNGRIVSAKTTVSGGRETHVIKVLTDDGKVKTVRVPGHRV